MSPRVPLRALRQSDALRRHQDGPIREYWHASLSGEAAVEERGAGGARRGGDLPLVLGERSHRGSPGSNSVGRAKRPRRWWRLNLGDHVPIGKTANWQVSVRPRV